MVMASLTQWTWVWASSRSGWWTGRHGMLQSMRLQRVGHDWETQLNWRYPLCGFLCQFNIVFKLSHLLGLYAICGLWLLLRALWSKWIGGASRKAAVQTSLGMNSRSWQDCRTRMSACPFGSCALGCHLFMIVASNVCFFKGFFQGTTMSVEERAGEGIDLSDFSFLNALSKH